MKEAINISTDGYMDAVRGVVYLSSGSTYQDIIFNYEYVGAFESEAGLTILECNGLVITSVDLGSNTKLYIPDILEGERVVGINLGGGLGDSLYAIELSDNIQFIGNRCFESCTNLTYIKIPNKVEYIGDNAFYGCGDLTVHFQNGFDYEGAYNNREDPFGAWGRYFGAHAFITEGHLTIEIYMYEYLEIQHGMFGEYGFIIDRGAFDEGLITFVPYENDESYQ